MPSPAFVLTQESLMLFTFSLKNVCLVTLSLGYYQVHFHFERESPVAKVGLEFLILLPLALEN